MQLPIAQPLYATRGFGGNEILVGRFLYGCSGERSGS